MVIYHHSNILNSIKKTVLAVSPHIPDPSSD